MKILNKHVDNMKLVHVVLYVFFGMLFGDDITIFWDENLLLFTFLSGKVAN